MSKYGRIIGSSHDYHYQHNGTHIHLVMDVMVNNQVYEADVNLFSYKGEPIQFSILDQPVTDTDTDILIEGVKNDVTLNYVSNLHLTDTDFTPIDPLNLYHLLYTLGQSCKLVILYGMIYHDGGGGKESSASKESSGKEDSSGGSSGKCGIHDIHCNLPLEGHDGAIGFYMESKKPHIQWVYLKFPEQHLTLSLV